MEWEDSNAEAKALEVLSLITFCLLSNLVYPQEEVKVGGKEGAPTDVAVLKGRR